MSKIPISKQISEMVSGSRQTLAKVSPCGSIYARKNSIGTVIFFWRFSQAKINHLVQIGQYDPAAHPKSTKKTDIGFSISGAIFQAEILARSHYENKGNGGFTQIRKNQEVVKKEILQAKEESVNLTLGKLLIAYSDYLEKIGRKSYKDVRNTFKKDVIAAWPKTANTQANEVSSEQIANILRFVYENGHARTSNKLRSFIRAAYQVAKSSKNKASIPAVFKSFQVTHNPAADTEPDTSANKADRNPLSLSEMQTYWTCIKEAPGFKGAVLRLHLLTGGLRIEQLVNLETANSSEDEITLHDIKGRTGASRPRPYTTPLIAAAAESLKICNPVGHFALSTDSGKTHLSSITLWKWSRDMVAESIPNFSLKRIRSGIETLLARQKFSKDLRGRLQSHGVSGVQDTHYDGHDYIDEKREMLTVLFNILNGNII